jgi:hypothetical protein
MLRKFLPVLTLGLLCGACKWEGAGAGVSAEQHEMGLKDVDALADEYESKAYWAGVRQRRDGRSNAFGRDLHRIVQTFDRHFLNYSWTDPYVNYKTNTSSVDHMMRFVTTPLAR